jgi:sialidase-1
MRQRREDRKEDGTMMFNSTALCMPAATPYFPVFAPSRLGALALSRTTLALLIAVVFCVACAAAEPAQTDVFTAGADGYHTYRIPALVATQKGTLLAICEGRKTGRGDHGDLDLVLKRSTDGGQTWGKLELIHEEGGTAKVTIGNPCPVVDQSTGTIWLPLTRDNDRVLMTSSSDDGKTWAKPRDITADVKASDWNWYATGPGNGIQLTRGKHLGRLVIPCDHRVGASQDDKENWDKAGRSHVIYSDDHGQTWKLGGSTDFAMNECAVVELPDGTLMLNSRSYRGKACRGVSLSKDGGATWEPTTDDPALVESVCQASLISFDAPGSKAGDRSLLVFSNPAVPKGRHHLTVRLSEDDGKTWTHSRLVCEGSSAYSSLAALPGGEIGLLYERNDYKQLTFTRFPPSWAMEKKDAK